ncbi:small ribosomal subunit biogenesis GTPase RsgA [Spirulina major CS-329]|uniref:small ribosomal subunit biogenesis GTPase RsgA n=1 Tax=Spirulina TaxID=1154 RepID=UPI00232B7C7C|nr:MULTISPECIES: small ribosomal subunit biogenesis GTPase RsgA [Spirulina]MDB9495331.1 small ribosomal subunit biogenesis GTPase RsgA [Spirulina subsalsa CS-330]MDB9504776.1 small ribosomal subunit biogenesis GTPase RsgA [Spirulina major CS-329]
MTTDPSLRWAGMVVAKQANFYQVRLEGATPATLLCTRRSRLKKLGQRVMVGDRVQIEDPDFTDAQGVICEILPRRTCLDRPPIANADQILLVFAIAQPALDPWQLSRFLIQAEATGIATQICLNKCDLVPSTEQQHWQARLQAWGYDPLVISVEHQTGLDQLATQLADRVTLFAGPSGVGKSSLIRTLIPDVDVRVAAVSGKLQRGRHTTRHVELFELTTGGLLADSPGFNKPDLVCEAQQLAGYFPEIRDRLAANPCQFNDCIHHNEPHCGVRGEWERYEHYLKFLAEAIAAETIRQQQPDSEAYVKVKIKTAGQRTYEPRLDSKKYRRTSRRHHHQTLKDWETELNREDLPPT